MINRIDSEQVTTEVGAFPHESKFLTLEEVIDKVKAPDNRYISRLIKQGGFPSPAWTIGRVEVWSRSEVDLWINEVLIRSSSLEVNLTAINRSEKVKLFKVIGERMSEARRLCGFTQRKAAELLGYSNSSKLAKIENASVGEAPPIMTIFKASKIFSVSLDFLFGESSDWERDPIVSQERQIGAMLHEQSIKAISKQTLMLGYFCKKQSVIEKTVCKLSERAKTIEEALEKMMALNPECEGEWKGLAKLQRLIIEAVEESAGIDRELKRNKMKNDIISETEDLNLDIFKNMDEDGKAN